jgi:predicted nucleotidyltransferase
MLSINSLLKNYADQLFISYNDPEREKIKKSYSNLVFNLKSCFGNNISSIKQFGSFPRGTILPRTFDDNSDIDILILFNQETFSRTPEVYRNHLIDFSQKYYQTSSSKKNFPTVVLELLFIKYDLVPAYIETIFLFENTYIPDRRNEWQKTDPNGFNVTLSDVNKKYNSIVKPVIRLLKFWNAKHHYPYYSFDLEKKITEMNFSGDNYESGFFYAIDHLDTWFFTQDKVGKAVESLRSNAKNVKDYLKQDNREKVLLWLNRILPFD